MTLNEIVKIQSVIDNRAIAKDTLENRWSSKKIGPGWNPGNNSTTKKDT